MHVKTLPCPKLCLWSVIMLQWQIQGFQKERSTNAISLTQYSIMFICRFYRMLLSWMLLVTLMGIYTINNNNLVHSESTTVPKTKRISRGNPRQMNLKTVDKFEQNIISKQKELKMSSHQGMLMLFIIIIFFIS